MKIVSIMWSSYAGMLMRASENLKDFVEVSAYSSMSFEKEPEKLDQVLLEASKADALFLYRSTEGFWDNIEPVLKDIGKQIPIICIGHDPSYWMLSTVNPEILINVNSYLLINGEENFTNMLRYIASVVGHIDLDFEEPKPVPWEGLYHPDAEVSCFENIDDYFLWYKKCGNKRADANRTYGSDAVDTMNLRPDTGYHKPNAGYRKSDTYEQKPVAGILFSRHQWVNDNLKVENSIIRELETAGFSVIPAFSYSIKDISRQCKGSGEVVCDYFLSPDGKSRIDIMIKMQNFFLSGTREKGPDDEEPAAQGVEILKKLNIPVISPVVSYYKTIDEWEKDPEGLGSSVGWSISMPEFEGVIEPVIIGATNNTDDGPEKRMPIGERCKKLAARAAKWAKLGKKSVKERKIVFFLNNNPCASVEGAVGGGAHLDTLESVVRVMQKMKSSGYDVNPPENGKELIKIIMDKKAISEFRWTSIEEIVSKGGVLDYVSVEQYKKWFDKFPEHVKKRMCEVWGNPPGEEKDGVPAAMVYDGKIVVTGVSFGNVVVAVQPKRGCAGSRCDGQVCKILHDPDVPPPHQYIATYRYMQDIWGADAVVHVGTHGNLEFLPGKSTGLSNSCFPDIAIGDVPHLYIYNSDNSPEGAIAKRRSLATLVDHLQTVITRSGLYGDLEEIDRLLGEYEQVKNIDKARTHMLKHLIEAPLEKSGILNGAKLGQNASFDKKAAAAHGALSLIRNSGIQDGMHIFGELPKGDRRIEFINAILRYDAGENNSVRKIICRLMGLELVDLLENQDKFSSEFKKSYGELLEDIDTLCKKFIKEALFCKNNENNELAEKAKSILKVYLKDKSAFNKIDNKIDIDIDKINILKEKIFDLNARIDQSKEIESLLNGFNSGYIPAGPSGLMTKGRDDILPTGRNFYSLDPSKVPTRAAWEIGKRLAEAIIKKHREEQGRIPENVGIAWMCSDIMWSGGEGMGQIMYLIGVRPVWLSNGRLKGFEIIPLEELGRPRIDITIRVSGITRDNFPGCIYVIDEAVQAVAALKEPVEKNFVRKHTLAQMEKSKAEKPKAEQAVIEQSGQTKQAEAEQAEAEHEQTEAEQAKIDFKESWRNATFRLFASKPGTYQAGTQLAVYASAWKTEKDLSDIFIYWNGYAYGRNAFGEEKHKQFIENLKTVDITYSKVVSDEYDLLGCCTYFGTHGGMTAAARTLSDHEVKTYYGDTREPEHIEVRDMADEIRRVVRTKLLNPKWIKGMKRHGYKGAGDIAKRVGRVYGWEATTREVDDQIFDDIAKTFVLNETNFKFFEDNNPWALEEIGRRLLEAESRKLWNADPEVFESLQERYLEIEGCIEDKTDNVTGDIQGGSVDVFTPEDVKNWQKKLQKIME